MAQPEHTRNRAYYDTFAAGMVTSVPPEEVPDEGVVRALNMVLDRQSNLKSRNGVERLATNHNLAQGHLDMDAKRLITGSTNYVYDFDGVNDRVALGTPTSWPAELSADGSFSVEYKAFSDSSLSGQQRIISANDATQGGFWAGTESGDVRFVLHDGTSNRIFVLKNSIDAQWNHFAWVWDNPNRLLKAYMNGLLEKTWFCPNIDLAALSSTPGAQVYFGGSGTASNFNGKAFDIRVWLDARTDAEILANWETLTITGGDPDYLWYKLNETSGTVANATGTPAAGLPTSVNWSTTLTGGGLSQIQPDASTNPFWAGSQTDNQLSGSSILDYGVGTDPLGNASSTMAFDVSDFDTAIGGSGNRTGGNVMASRNTIRSVDTIDKVTCSQYFKRAAGADAITLATDPSSPDAVLYEANPATLYVQLSDTSGVNSTRLYSLKGDWHEQAASGDHWYGVGFQANASQQVRTTGAQLVHELGITSATTGGGREFVLPTYQRYDLYDASWNLLGTYDAYYGPRFGGSNELFFEIPLDEEGTFPSATPAYALAQGAPSGADYTTGSISSYARDTSVATTSIDGYFSDEVDDWTNVSAISGNVVTPGAGGSFITAFNDSAAEPVPKRPVVTFGWDAGTVTKPEAGITVKLRAYAAWSAGTPTSPPATNTATLNLELQEFVGTNWVARGLTSQDFSGTTDETLEIDLAPGVYQGGALRLIATGNIQSYSGVGGVTQRYIEPVAVSVESKLVEYITLDGTDSAVTGFETDFEYGLQESGDFFKLWMTIPTTGYDQLAWGFIPYDGDYTFDKTSGVYMGGNQTDIDTSVRTFKGDVSSADATVALVGGDWTNDNDDREMWGIECYPDDHQSRLPTPTSDSNLNFPEEDLITEFTSVYEHLDPVLATRLYATGLNTHLEDYDGSSAEKHHVLYFDNTAKRWVRFRETWNDTATPEAYSFKAPDTTLYPIPPSWESYDGYALLAVPGSQLISFDTATVDPTFVNTDETDQNTASAYASDAPELHSLKVWNNRVYGAVWDGTNDKAMSQIKGTKVGSPDDWADVNARSGSVTIDIAGSDSAPVTALAVYEQKLFVFTRDKIYFIQAGQPNVDLMQYNLQQWSDEAGCLSHRTCQIVGGDLTFLSDEGIVRLKSVADQGNLERGLLSVAIEEFDRLSDAYADQAVTFLDPKNARYHVAFPSDGGAKNNRMFVLDYTNQPAWTEFDGAIVGNDFHRLEHTTSRQNHILVAGRAAPKRQFAHVLTYEDDDTRWLDDGKWYEQSITTKAFTQGDEILKKRYHRCFAKFRLEQGTLNLDGQYQYDLFQERTQTFGVSFSGDASTGSQYDSAIFNTDTYGGSPNNVRTFRYRMHGAQGRYAQSVQFRLANTSGRDEGWTLVAMGFYYTAATSKYTDG